MEEVGAAVEASVDEELVVTSPTEVETDWEPGATVKSELVEPGEADWCDDEQLSNGCVSVLPSTPGVAM